MRCRNVFSLVSVIALAAVAMTSSNAFAGQKFFRPFMSKKDAKSMELRQSFLKRDGGGITQDQFNSAIKLVTDSYQAIIAAHGATLNVSADWADDTINASADQSGSTWDLNFYGGLARVSYMTEDGMALVVCHEMSHHLGGFPFLY